MAGVLNVEADELSWGLNLNEDLEWALDMDIFRKLWVGSASQTLPFLHLGSIINFRLGWSMVCDYGIPWPYSLKITVTVLR